MDARGLDQRSPEPLLRGLQPRLRPRDRGVRTRRRGPATRLDRRARRLRRPARAHRSRLLVGARRLHSRAGQGLPGRERAAPRRRQPRAHRGGHATRDRARAGHAGRAARDRPPRLLGPHQQQHLERRRRLHHPVAVRGAPRARADGPVRADRAAAALQHDPRRASGRVRRAAGRGPRDDRRLQGADPGPRRRRIVRRWKTPSPTSPRRATPNPASSGSSRASAPSSPSSTSRSTARRRRRSVSRSATSSRRCRSISAPPTPTTSPASAATGR